MVVFLLPQWSFLYDELNILFSPWHVACRGPSCINLTYVQVMFNFENGIS